MCFSAFSRSRPRWLAVRATHIPRRPKKKPLRGKKVGFAEKKLRLPNSGRGVAITYIIQYTTYNRAPLSNPPSEIADFCNHIRF